MNIGCNRRSRMAAFSFVASVFLLCIVARTAEAVSFTALNSSPCITSGGADVGGFCSDIGIDYSQLTGNLVTSVHFDSVPPGTTNNLDKVNRITGARTSIAVSGLADELKVATVRQVQGACPQQWPVGTLFTGTVNGKIVRVDPNGFATTLVTLPGEAGSSVRGGLFFDRWCVAGGDLIAVTGTNDPITNVGGTVWRINSFGVATKLATIFKAGNPSFRAHLEGVITVPNDPKYGPWAGKIVTGDESRINLAGGYQNGPHPKIYATDPSTGACGQNTNVALSAGCSGGTDFTISGPTPHPEDFDFIEGDFYGNSYLNSDDGPGGAIGAILKAPASDFPAQSGSFPHIPTTQDYPY